MTQPSERTTRAEIEIRDRIADLIVELHASESREDVRTIVKVLCSLERYIETASASASDKEDRLLAAL